MSWDKNTLEKMKRLGSPSPTQPNSDFTKAIGAGKKVERNAIDPLRQAQPVAFPRHLFIPEGAQSIDLRKYCSVASGSVKESLMRFVAPEGAQTYFMNYGIISDGLLSADIEFIPTVDGIRIFPYHGDPSNNYKMSLGLAPDLSNSSLIPCQLTLNPNQVLEWFVTNNGTVAANMGVRMVGYFDSSIKRTTNLIGG